MTALVVAAMALEAVEMAVAADTVKEAAVEAWVAVGRVLVAAAKV